MKLHDHATYTRQVGKDTEFSATLTVTSDRERNYTKWDAWITFDDDDFNFTKTYTDEHGAIVFVESNSWVYANEESDMGALMEALNN